MQVFKDGEFYCNCKSLPDVKMIMVANSWKHVYVLGNEWDDQWNCILRNGRMVKSKVDVRLIRSN